MGDAELVRERADALTVSMPTDRLGHLVCAESVRYRATSHLVDSTATARSIRRRVPQEESGSRPGDTTKKGTMRHTM
jgi:hypothetical protein